MGTFIKILEVKKAKKPKVDSPEVAAAKKKIGKDAERMWSVESDLGPGFNSRYAILYVLADTKEQAEKKALAWYKGSDDKPKKLKAHSYWEGEGLDEPENAYDQYKSIIKGKGVDFMDV